MPEEGGGGPAGHNEAVVVDGQGTPELVGPDLALLDVDLAHLGQQDGQVAQTAQHVTDGRRDLALRKDAGGHLVQQRLEEVVVGPVDDGDPHRRPLQRPGREEAAEAAAHDDDVVLGVRRAHRRVFTTVSTYWARGSDDSSSSPNHPTASVVPSASGRSVPSQASTR